MMMEDWKREAKAAKREGQKGENWGRGKGIVNSHESFIFTTATNEPTLFSEFSKCSKNTS